MAKKVQGAIPVVSLVSKLLSPEGGIGGEALSYNEYCRAKLDAAGGTAFGDALSRLCDDCGKEPRTVLLLAWMVYEGRGTCGFEPAERGGSSRNTGFDYEYEIYRFEQARDAAKTAAGRGRGRRRRGRGRGGGGGGEGHRGACGGGRRFRTR